MKKTGIMLCALCLAILAVSLAIGTTSAAIIPFNGTEYSWLHPDYKGDPTGDWHSQIDDDIAVRPGDAMQFQNRYYNGYAGTADVRISYGGGQPYVCAGAEEYLFYGLNYGNYYPSGTAAVPLYSTVSNCSDEPNNLVVNHQYVYNGLVYGSCVSTDKWTMKLHRASPEELAAMPVAAPEQQNDTPATVTPAATQVVQPTVNDGPTPSLVSGLDAPVALACALAIACFVACTGKKRQI
jgi:hypothetical protein